MHLILTFLTYLYLQLKRAAHKLPVLLWGIFLLTGIVGIIAYCSISIYAHTMEEGLLTEKLSIDLVIQDTEKETSLALQFIENMESTKNILTFRTVSMEEAYRDLDARRTVAVMILPPDVLQSILDGTNQSIQILFPASSDLSTLIVRELTNSGAVMLDAAQSGIYTLTDLYLEENLQSYLEDSYRRLNQINLSYALARERLFTMKNTSVLGAHSVFTYYTSSAVWLILLLFGILCAPFLARESACFTDKLRQAGISTPLMILSKWITTICVYISIYIGVYLVIRIFLFVIPANFTNFAGSSVFPVFPIFQLAPSEFFSIPLSASFWGTFFLLIAFVSAYVVLFYEITPNAATGILCITICSIILLFLSGAFIPVAFFPDPLKAISHILPTTYGLRGLSSLLSMQSAEWITLAPIIGYTLIFLGISCIKIRQR